MDDGGGASISWTVLSLLHALNLRARRTVRCVLWSCEEFGGIGADQYFDAHENEISKMSIVMESDMGVFHPIGLQFLGNAEARQVKRSFHSIAQIEDKNLLYDRSSNQFLSN